MTASEVSPHQIEAEWCEARQMLNDYGLSHYDLPEAVDRLLGYLHQHVRRVERPEGVIDLAAVRRSKGRHPSRRRRADLTVPPEVTR